MNYEEIITKIETERQEAELKSKSKVEDIITTMRNKGIEEAEINFNGSGDEGSIDYVDFSPSVENTTKLEEEIEEWAYDLLESTGVDWYNNEGGFGTIKINVNEKKYSYEVNQRIESYELAASGEEKI